LCWQTVEQQFIPALAIASAVTGKRKDTLQLDDIDKKNDVFEANHKERQYDT